MNRPAATKTGMITGLFRDRESSERAWRAAVELGYDPADINLLLSEDTRERLFGGDRSDATGLSDKAAETAEEPKKGAEQVGGPAGGTVGTIAPALAAIGALLLIPGGILAAGPIAIALTAAGAVGVAGGLIGALTDWGIPKGRVELYESGIREGGILIGVKPRSDEDARRVSEQWEASGGELVHS